MSQAPTDDRPFEQEPEPWRILPIARIHPPVAVPHSVTSMLVPHTHLIPEDVPPAIKNELALHIEQYHGRRT